ncbi:hypothetical protein ACEQ8H_007423 [Pleosporales sp. CAS-2024a]
MHVTASQLLLYIASATAISPTQVILERQCWIEHTLVSASHYTSKSGQEYVYPVYKFIQPQPKDYSPWSRAPVCTPKLSSIDDILCIYSSSSFGSGRGISIFTTPLAAKQFLELPAFKHKLALQERDVNVPTDVWRASSIPNKGIGLIASKPLEFGDRIMSYTPVFMAYLEGELSPLDRETWWRYAIDQLPERSRDEFLNLARILHDDRVMVQEIVKSNTFQMEVGGVNHLTVFLETSRLNHACDPNAQYIIDVDTLSHTVHATRSIAEGEEISIAYTSPLESTHQRQEKLQTSFHFTCSCPRCTSPSSDMTLAKIQALQNQLNDWSAPLVGSPEIAEQNLQLHRDEGLEGFMDIAYGFAALAYSAAGDKAGATSYAQKARQAILMKDGSWSANYRIWEDMLKDVHAHWSWQRRM